MVPRSEEGRSGGAGAQIRLPCRRIQSRDAGVDHHLHGCQASKRGRGGEKERTKGRWSPAAAFLAAARASGGRSGGCETGRGVSWGAAALGAGSARATPGGVTRMGLEDAFYYFSTAI